jgi:predicted RecB family nuclease
MRISGSEIMATKITRDVLESYLNCRTKAHLKLAGQQGSVSDYEALLDANRQNVRQSVIGKILSKYPEGEVARDISLTAAALRAGPSFVLDATLEDDLLSLRFDGLKKVAGPSKLGGFHYAPMLFHPGRKVGKEQRRLLELYGLLLSQIQGRRPTLGVVWHERECKPTRVRLNQDIRRIDRDLREVKEVVGAVSPPTLILNDHCQVCEFRQRCHNQAVQEDNISLLRGVGEKEIRSYARKGIFTITQLAHTFRPRRKGKRRVQRTNKRYPALQALAVRDKRIYVFGTPELPASPLRIYLDMEGDPDEGYIYLIGMIIVRGDSETRKSFWADGKDQEVRIFEEFMAEVSKYEDFVVFCYGGYERAFLKRMQSQAKWKAPVGRVIKALVNTLSLIYSHIYFPTYSNGLKDIGGWLGCSWMEPDASGIQSVVWRKRWEATRGEEWKQKLMNYNLEDCAALNRVAEVVYVITDMAKSAAAPGPSNVESLPIVRVQDIDQLANDRKWGRINFIHQDFAFINNRSYFDYQRERVFVRTSRALRKNRKRRKNFGRQNLRVTKHTKIISSSCPACGGHEITTEVNRNEVSCAVPRVKMAYDLVFTPGGIKRKVIECRSSVHQCLKCRHAFVPERHVRLDKHFHSLKSWAIYQHVAHRLSFDTIHTMFEEFFGLRINSCEIHMFKSLMARYYRDTYRALLKGILSGNLLHVDETEVKLRSGKGYVWVFTSLEEVVFMYRPTREGDFLRDLLKDFHGVLVSDFYAAYDSIDCQQQKCLIHLMRDMNQELLNNPFDEELRSITQPFGGLLRAVVETVDEHGLKRRHLQKHKRAVDGFFHDLTEHAFRSEAAETLRNRLMKYQRKLFTFIDHDGVTWNNNNAENAIKMFAYYREDTAGIMSEEGLSDYLVLLSLYQTCRYKGASFLKFLVSGQRDVDAFCLGKRSRRRWPAIQMYPKGFTPPHFPKREKRITQQSEGTHDEI